MAAFFTCLLDARPGGQIGTISAHLIDRLIVAPLHGLEDNREGRDPHCQQDADPDRELPSLPVEAGLKLGDTGTKLLLRRQ